MLLSEINNESLWSQGKFSSLEKKPFFRIDFLKEKDSKEYGFNKPYSIFMQGADFNSDIHSLIKSGEFGEYNRRRILSLQGEEPENYRNQEGELIWENVKSKDIVYMYYVSNIECILDKVVKIENSLEVIL